MTDKVKCTCCDGTGEVEVTGRFLDTLKMFRAH